MGGVVGWFCLVIFFWCCWGGGGGGEIHVNVFPLAVATGLVSYTLLLSS